MTNKKIFTVTLAVMIIHFILTSIIGHYIAEQIGAQMGKIVADDLVETSDKKPDKTEEEANRIYQNMKSKSDIILKSWKIPSLLISFPAKPFIEPYLINYRNTNIKKVLTKEISKEQFYSNGVFLNYAAVFVNSLVFGLLVYIALRLINNYRLKHNNRMH